MSWPVTCPESPALATKKKSWNNLMMLRMSYVAVHGYIVMAMPTIIICDYLSYSSLPYPLLCAHVCP